MATNVFITGASGFIGGHLLKRLDELSFERIYCLHRNQETEPCLSPDTRVSYIKGDLGSGDTYAGILASCDTVLHLAAATGKVPKDEYYKANVNGTAELIRQCNKAGVKKFLFISTIAVKYSDKTNYDYAQSKEQAEEVIRSSGLDYAIVRPTIVIDQDSPVWKSLSRLAKLSIIPYFGNGATQIQPIFVDDLVNCLISIVISGTYDNQTYDIGGPDVISFRDFLKQIHYSFTGKNPWVIEIPYKPIRAVFSALEGRFYDQLPVTVGQLSAFNNDGTIQVNRLFTENASKMMGIRVMINQQVSQSKLLQKDRLLERECEVYTRFLIRQNPSDYIIRKYEQAHANLAEINTRFADPYEIFLVNLAAKNRILTRIVDAYSSFFFKKSLLRRKLILLLAILECSPPYYENFETPDSTNFMGTILKLIFRGLKFLIAIILGLILVLPAKVYYSLNARSASIRGES